MSKTAFRKRITPTAPTINTPTVVSSTEVDLSWSGAANASTLAVQRSLDNVSFSTLSGGTLSGSATTFADTTVAASTTYFWRIIATSIDGITATSNTVTATTPAGLLPFDDNLGSYSPGALPLNWGQLDSGIGGHLTALVVADTSMGGVNTIHGGNTRKQFIWVRDNTGTDIQFPADVKVKAPVLSGDQAPTGSGPAGRVTVTAGAITQGYNLRIGSTNGATLWKCLAGTWSELATVNGPFNRNVIYDAELDIQGSSPVSLKVICHNRTNGLYLQPDGTESSTVSFCLSYNDSTSPITGGGLCGIYADLFQVIAFGEFQVLSAAADVTPPTVSLTSPINGNTYSESGSGSVTFTATASDNVGGSGMNKVELWADPTVSVGDLVNGTGTLLATVSAPGPYTTAYSGFQNGAHTAVARAYDVAGNHAISTVVNFTVTGSTLPTLPTFSSALPNLWVGGETYGGFPVGATIASSLMDADSLAILPSLVAVDGALTTIRGVSPNCNTTYYANISQIYGSIILDWVNYADANSLDRESAFYHVLAPTTFTQINATDALPPCSFHQLFSSTDFIDRVGNWVDSVPVLSATAGDIFYVGHIWRTRQILATVATAASGGWAGVWEYCTAVDINGHPTTWTTLPILSDATSGFTVTGQHLIDYDPPTNDLACLVTGQPSGKLFSAATDPATYRFFYRRFRITHSGTAPTFTAFRSRDFTGSAFNTSGSPLGTVPQYDYASDTGNVGFLTAAQYAGRASGKDAYFAYEGQSPDATYGWGRQPTFVKGPNFQAWCVDYHVNRFIPAQVTAGRDPDGVSMDNCSGAIGLSQGNIKESLSNYVADLATCVKGIWNALGSNRGSHRWVNANLSKAILGGSDPTQNNAIEFVKHSPAVTYEGIRNQFADTYHSLLTYQDGVNTVKATVSPAPIQVIDSVIDSWPSALYGSGTPGEFAACIDPASAYNDLCYYYQLATTNCVCSIYGQNLTNVSFAYHWTQAALYDLGALTSASTLLDSRADPNDGTKTANTYMATFANGVAVFRPVSSGPSSGSGGVWGAGSASIPLGAPYYLLNIPLLITGTAAGAGGCVRITVAFTPGNNPGGNPTTGIQTGQKGIVAFVHGTAEANGTWTINVVDGTHLDLVGTTYTHLFTAPTGNNGSGGLLIWKSQTSQNAVTLVNGTGAILFNSP